MVSPALVFPQDEHNRILLSNVRPGDWKNPEPARKYNMVVIGAGTAGLVIAAGAAGLGAKVALIEQGLMGGDCLNVGCVPSKGLIRTARAVYDARSAGEFGVSLGSDPAVDFGKAMERMRRIRAGISFHDSAQRFSQELGVDVFIGHARFTARDSIDVEGKRLRFSKAAVCAGARPAEPRIPGIEEAGYITNENVFQLTELPKRVAVIGGGPVGCELAQAFARMGSSVTLVHRGGHLLPREDRDAAAVVQTALMRDRVLLRPGATVLNASKKGTEKALIIEENGSSTELVADQILVGVGRTPNIEGLDLEQAGINYDKRLGVLVDVKLRTSNPHVFAAGDVCSKYKFTHAADAMARIVIENALFAPRQKASELVIPWCTYTDPEVAHVGMYEKDAAAAGIAVQTLTMPLSKVDRALLDGAPEGFARVHLKHGTDRILGATIVARHAGEMINEISLAMTAGLGLSSIGRTIHPYPTQAEAVKKLADLYNRTRLTPFVRKVFTAWLKWQRR